MKTKKRSNFLESLSDKQLTALIRELGCGDGFLDRTLARAHYRDETTLGYTPWPGDNKAVKWQPHENPNREQRVLLMRACWRLLTGAELSEIHQLKTATIEVRFDFEAGYQWPEVTLSGKQADE